MRLSERISHESGLRRIVPRDPDRGHWYALRQMGVLMRLVTACVVIVLAVGCSTTQPEPQPQPQPQREPHGTSNQAQQDTTDAASQPATIETFEAEFASDPPSDGAAALQSSLTQRIQACEQTKGMMINNIVCKQTMCRLELSFVGTTEKTAINGLMGPCEFVRVANLQRVTYFGSDAGASPPRLFLVHRAGVAQ